MKLSIHKKRMIALLGLLALVVAWWQWPTIPRNAQAAATAQFAPGGQPTTMPVVDTDELIRWLTRSNEPEYVLAQTVPTRKLFAPPSEVEIESVPAAQPSASQPAAPSVSISGELAHGLRLDGVIVGESSLASISGRLYRKGAIIAGFRVIDIGRDFVRLEKDSADVVLQLDTQLDR